MSVRELRSILGNCVRLVIMVDAVHPRPYRGPQLAAVWDCGCEARGLSFAVLALAPCGAHIDADLAAVALG